MLVDRRGDIVTITLDRPEKRNALAVEAQAAIVRVVNARSAAVYFPILFMWFSRGK